MLDCIQEKLRQLGEYIDDTEATISLRLEINRNKLLHVEIVLTTIGVCLAFFALVAGEGMSRSRTDTTREPTGPRAAPSSIAPVVARVGE